jgi:hypothetical protein
VPATRRLLTSSLAAAALLAGCGGDDASDDATIAASPAGFEAVAGDWSGTLHQSETEPFPIDVHVESQDDPKLNVVHYGGEIACSGNWTYLGADGTEVSFREVIDRGRGGRCKGSGTVRLTTTGDPGRLDYSFSGGGVESEGVLGRG